MSVPTITEKRIAFRRLHDAGCFVLPNPWDCGSARALAAMGFQAVATTSAGYAWSTGRADGTLSCSEVLAHVRSMVEAVALPVNADFENGFASSGSQLEENLALLIETGVAGFSLEDATGDPNAPLMKIEDAAQRISLARATIDQAGGEVLLVGRAENFFIGLPDMDDVIQRLKAYAEAGADCLYAPGIKTRKEIQAVVAAVAPKPVNVLIGWDSDLTVAELAALGVRRVSVGGALARCAWGGFLEAARTIKDTGQFSCFAGRPPASALNDLFKSR